MHPSQMARAATAHRRLSPDEFRTLDRQVSDTEPQLTVEDLAEAMRRQFPNCTEASLQAEGFTLAFQLKHGDKARELANARFVRHETRPKAPVKSIEQLEAEATALIFELLPSPQRVVAELQAHGITKPQIDVILSRAKARAALLYAGGKPGSN